MKVILATVFIGLIASSYAAFKPECPKGGSGNELIPDPENCGRFYICRNYVAYEAYCPYLTFFDVVTLSCVGPKEATCAGGQPPVLPVDCPEQQGSDENILLPNPKDCTTFYQCVYGYPHLQHCPKGLHFNPKKDQCDWPAAVKCTAKPQIKNSLY